MGIQQTTISENLHAVAIRVLALALHLAVPCLGLLPEKEVFAASTLEIAREACRSSLREYPRLRERFLATYSVGISANELIAKLRRTAHVVVDGQAVLDPLDGSISRAAPGTIDCSSVKRDSKSYSFKVTCVPDR